MAKVFKDLLFKKLTPFQRLQGVRPTVNPGTYELEGGGIAKLKYCECNSYGREMCANCAVQPEYTERPLVLRDTVRPSWWRRYIQTQLSAQDIQFLTGVRPHFKRRGR